MAPTLAVLLLLLVALSVVSGVWAQEDVEAQAEAAAEAAAEVGEESSGESVDDADAAAAQAAMEAEMRRRYPQPSDEVLVSAVFPADPVKRTFVAGGVVEVVMGFENRGELPMTIRSLQAHLMNPYDYTQILQNYSRLGDDTVVAPNEQASVLYRFRSDPTTEAREYGLTGIVFYEDSEGQQYYHAYYNHTITLTEAEFEMDPSQHVLAVVVVVLLAAVVHKIGITSPQGQDKKQLKKAAATAAKGKGKGKGKGKVAISSKDGGAWLEDTAARSPKSKRN